VVALVGRHAQKHTGSAAGGIGENPVGRDAAATKRHQRLEPEVAVRRERLGADRGGRRTQPCPAGEHASPHPRPPWLLVGRRLRAAAIPASPVASSVMVAGAGTVSVGMAVLAQYTE